MLMLMMVMAIVNLMVKVLVVEMLSFLFFSLPNVNLWVCWANLTRLIATGSLAKAYLRHGGHGQQLRYAIGSNLRNAPSYPNLFTVTIKWDHFRMALHSNHSYLIPNTGLYWDIMFPLSQNISYTIYYIPYTIYHISYIIYPISDIRYPISICIHGCHGCHGYHRCPWPKINQCHQPKQPKPEKPHLGSSAIPSASIIQAKKSIRAGRRIPWCVLNNRNGEIQAKNEETRCE